MIHPCSGSGSRGTTGGCAICQQRYRPGRVQTQRALPAESHLQKLHVSPPELCPAAPGPGGGGTLLSKNKGGKDRLNTGLPSHFRLLSTTAQVPTAFPETLLGSALEKQKMLRRRMQLKGRRMRRGFISHQPTAPAPAVGCRIPMLCGCGTSSGKKSCEHLPHLPAPLATAAHPQSNDAGRGAATLPGPTAQIPSAAPTGTGTNTLLSTSFRG